MVRSATEHGSSNAKVVTIKSNKNKAHCSKFNQIDERAKGWTEKAVQSSWWKLREQTQRQRDCIKKKKKKKLRLNGNSGFFWFDPKQSKTAYKKLIGCRWWFCRYTHMYVFVCMRTICLANLLQYGEYFVLYMLSVFAVYQLLLPQPHLVPSTGTQHRNSFPSHFSLSRCLSIYPISFTRTVQKLKCIYKHNLFFVFLCPWIQFLRVVKP